jgi:small subunit ribosomal protein S6
MENLYNTIFIVDISQNPDEAETVTSRIQQLIEDHGGIIKKINRWGKRRMAFSIESKSHGFYVEIEYSANSRLNIPKILEGEFRLNDRVFRYMTYIVSKKELIQREKNAGKMQRKQEQQEEEKPVVTEQKTEVPVEAEEKIPEMEEKVEIEPVKEEDEQGDRKISSAETEKEVAVETAPVEESPDESSEEGSEESSEEALEVSSEESSEEDSEKSSEEALEGSSEERLEEEPVEETEQEKKPQKRTKKEIPPAEESGGDDSRETPTEGKEEESR